MLGRGTRLVGATYEESVRNGKSDCLVLDMVGNSAKHRLIGPADALAGRDLGRRRAEAGREEAGDDNGQTELDGVLDFAEKEAAAASARRKAQLNSGALVLYRQREIDLFLGDTFVDFDRNSPAAQRPATAEQLAIADAKLGVPPAGLCEAEAAAMLQAVKERRKQGLCSIPQARCLEKLGIDTKAMTFARAGELMSKVGAAKTKFGNRIWKQPYLIFSGEPEFRPGRKRA
jgi:hypothetical protein